MSTLNNKVQLIGHIGAAPEIRNIETGAKVARIRIATTDRYKTGSGEWKEETMWHTVSAWEKLAEKSNELQKGSHVMIEGKLVNKAYTDRSGNKKFFTEVRASNITMVDKKKTGTGDTQNAA